jgi:DNA polymerase-3 subunit gamma/tau
MDYIAFARKYRPQTFDDIAGQPHIATTLKNAIARNRIAHAYLFTGPRGVGKTTTARIFAKAVNCEKGPTSEPCNKCASCLEITRGTSFDILEIDGASNRGIDEIRNLRENVKFAPSKGRYKLYIIDEVHMLTEPAFNALLKTLEEPPPHAVFVFATTQGYKVPATILSRCQRFDFRRIPSAVISDNLKMIAKSEKLPVDDAALKMIARYSEGSLRDAQVMLDQAASFGKGSVDTEGVTRMLGTLSDDALFAIAGAIGNKDAAGAVGMAGRFIDEGKDPFQITQSLIEHFRNMAVAKLSACPAELIDACEDTIERYRRAAEGLSVEDILYAVYTLSSSMGLIKRSGLGRIPLEAALIKLARGAGIAPIADIVARIEKLEKNTGLVNSPFPGLAPLGTSRDGRLTVGRKEEIAGRKAEEASTADPSGAGRPGPGVRDENTAPAKASSADLDEVLAAWGSIVKHVMNKKTFIGYYLQEGYPAGLDGKTLTIGFPKESKFHKEELESSENMALIEEALRASLHLDLKVSLSVSAAPAVAKKEDNSGYARQDDFASDPDDYSSKEMDPIVKAAMEMFGGEVAKGPAKRGTGK